MNEVAHSTSNLTTPTAPIPAVNGPICEEFTVRISSSAATSSVLERDPDGEWVGRLRRIGAAKLCRCGLAPLIDDAQLLISELLTNALRYGEGGEIEFRLVITSRGLLVAVNDGSADRPRLNVAGATDETGRGLYLVAAFADDWGVCPDGTTTWCTLGLARASR